MNADEIRNRLEQNGLGCRPELPEMLQLYLCMLRDWNSRMDLTSVADDGETVDRHFIDSLTVLKTGLADGAETLIDVGTGAGFPGLVLAMACPHMRVTLLDAQQKRLAFLQAVSEAAELRNVTLVHARAEDGARQAELRERFDLAAARALAPVNVLCEYLLPYVRTGGRALCWKGPSLRDELNAGRKAASTVGGQLEMPVRTPVAGRDWEHLILPILKTGTTPRAYPRRAGTPKSKPLGTP